MRLSEGDLEPLDGIRRLGLGWVAEEALAIGAYCALIAGHDVALGLRLAVNHDGDSDSTGSICGNLMGAALGEGALPPMAREVEMLDVICQIADDLVTALGPSESPALEGLTERYL